MRFLTMWYVRPAKGSDQPAHTRSLIRAFSSRLNILWTLIYWLNIFGVSKLIRKLHMLVWVNTCPNATLLEISWSRARAVCTYRIAQKPHLNKFNGTRGLTPSTSILYVCELRRLWADSHEPSLLADAMSVSYCMVCAYVREDNKRVLASGLSPRTYAQSYNNCLIAPVCTCTLYIVKHWNITQRCNKYLYMYKNLLCWPNNNNNNNAVIKNS